MKKIILTISILLISSMSFAQNKSSCQDNTFDYLGNEKGPLYKTIVHLQAEAQKHESAGNAEEELKSKTIYSNFEFDVSII